MRKNRKSYPIEFKKEVVAEYLQGAKTAEQIAKERGLERFQIYSWKIQLENREKNSRAEELSESGHSAEDVRRIMELEEELEAAKAKIADQALAIDLLKKIHPSFQSEKKSSGYAELKRVVMPRKGRVK